MVEISAMARTVFKMFLGGHFEFKMATFKMLQYFPNLIIYLYAKFRISSADCVENVFCPPL